ncbi:rho-related BTB domain-containing protein 3 [Mixophyes fleayi]|uniref:rho-related BTB domain-containing protein 3 n=1 Tax=Mixophyes fleayi TaxID=3061075 RepID=UPI003F4D73F9
MSFRIVSLGNEGNAFFEDGENSNLFSFYLGRRANGLLTEDSHPVFTVYQANILPHIQIVVYECPDWDTFESDSQRSQDRVLEADVIVIKFAVNDKTSFLDIKSNFAPLLKQIFNQHSVPIIVLAIGVRQNDGPPCTCPMCTSDREICVTALEGNQLAKDIGGTYLELHALNDFYVVKYFGGLLEYFILQTMNQRTAVNGRQKTKNQVLKDKPPKLGPPDKMPVLKDEPSRYITDVQDLLVRGQCVDVIFCTADMNPLSGAHRVVLCSVSSVFMLLFGVTTTREIYDSCTRRTAQALFSVYQEPAVTPQNSPVRVIVNDSHLHSCLPDILHFIYSGAMQWQLLEQHLKEKLKDGDVAHVYHLVKCMLKKPGQVIHSADVSLSHSKKPLQLSGSLGLFYNTPLLADVFFQVQDTKIPAHRAVLVARCDVMAAMFSGSYMEANCVLIPMYDISRDTFLAFLEYIYTDSFYPASILQALSLLICSEMYQVARLKRVCERYITTQLQSMPSRELSSTSLSVVNLLKKAKFHNSECLHTWLLYFIAAHYLVFSQKPEFQDLSAEELEFVENHKWPSNVYLNQLVEYRRYIHSPKYRCSVM